MLRQLLKLALHRAASQQAVEDAASADLQATCLMTR
jgi:hypothetical protein